MRGKILFAIREFIVIVISGGLPIILAYKFGGIDGLEKIMSELISSAFFLYYSAIMPVTFALLYFANKYIYIYPLGGTHNTIHFFLSTLYELSGNIVGVFRLASGVLLTFPFLVLVVEPESFRLFFPNFFLKGLLGFAEVAMFNWWFSKIRLRQLS